MEWLEREGRGGGLSAPPAPVADVPPACPPSSAAGLHSRTQLLLPASSSDLLLGVLETLPLFPPRPLPCLAIVLYSRKPPFQAPLLSCIQMAVCDEREGGGWRAGRGRIGPSAPLALLRRLCLLHGPNSQSTALMGLQLVWDGSGRCGLGPRAALALG